MGNEKTLAHSAKGVGTGSLVTNSEGLGLILLLVKTYVEGVRYLFNWKDERMIKGSVFFIGAVLAIIFQVSVFEMVGLKARESSGLLGIIIQVVIWFSNITIIAAGSMVAHDLLDRITPKR